MPKYLITGRPGVGKTTVIKELQARGFAAYSTDEVDGVTELEDTKTGEIVPFPERPVDWSRYSWKWQEPQLIALLNSAETVFVGAVVAEQEKLYSLFDKVYALEITSQTLAKRLAAHEYPRTPQEIASAVALFDKRQARFIEQGLTMIPADGPVEAIVDDILSRIYLD